MLNKFASLPLQYWLSSAFLSILRPEGTVIKRTSGKKLLVIIYVVSSSSSAPLHLCKTDGADSVKLAHPSLLSNLWFGRLENAAGVAREVLDGGT